MFHLLHVILVILLKEFVKERGKEKCARALSIKKKKTLVDYKESQARIIQQKPKEKRTRLKYRLENYQNAENGDRLIQPELTSPPSSMSLLSPSHPVDYDLQEAVVVVEIVG